MSMKNLFISLLMCITLFLGLPAEGEIKAPFLAVYCSQDLAEKGLYEDWERFKPDYIRFSDNWEDFESFILEVKRRSSGREILLDLDVHGDNDLILASNTLSHKPLGEVLNIIDTNLEAEKLTVLLESCFAPTVYKLTAHKGYNKVPNFPIYGVCGNHYGFNNLIFLQYYYKDFRCFTDLRIYENPKTRIGYKHMNLDDQENTDALFFMLLLRSYSY